MPSDSATPDNSPPNANIEGKRSHRWQPPTPEQLQMMLPQYAISGLLGRGGMGAVYKGTQVSLERSVAIKILPPGIDENDHGANYAERFKNEARAMAKLSHPGIVSVYDSGETPDGLLYIVMEFIEGTDVQKMVAQQGRLHSEHAMAITAHVCDALQYAHDCGIIHRDIKPANIMVGYNGVVKVADFGLAKIERSGESGLTMTGMAMGTLHYMAPEALMLGSSVDHRADVYAVGVMLYFMLTGRLPQGMFTPPSHLVNGLDPRFDAIISEAIRDDRDIRFQSASALRSGLDGVLTQPAEKVKPEAEVAPPALKTHARPQRPQPSELRTPDTMQPAVFARPPREKSGSFLWVFIVIAAALLAWFVGRPLLQPPLATKGAPVSSVEEPPASAPSGGESAKQSSTSAAQSGADTRAPNAASPPAVIPPPPHGLKSGVWHDMFAEGLITTAGLQRDSDGTSYRATSTVTSTSKPAFTDCVIRARFGAGTWTVGPQLIVRRPNAASDRYISAACFDYKAYLRNHQGGFNVFATANMEEVLQRDRSFELELEAIGDLFTFRKNGALQVSQIMTGYESGQVGFRLELGTKIESFQVMPLDGLTPAQRYAALLAGHSPPPPPPEPVETKNMRLVVDADFEKNPDLVPESRTPNLHLRCEDHSLRITALSKAIWWAGPSMLNKLKVENFVCEIEYRVPKAAGGRWGLGLTPPTMPWVGVAMSAAGKMDISRYDEKGLVPPTNTKASPAGGDWNTLRVEAFEGQLRVFVNGSHAADALTEGIKKPHPLNLFMATPEPSLEVWVRRLKVWQPDEEASAPAVASSAKTSPPTVPSPPPSAVPSPAPPIFPAKALPQGPQTWTDIQGRRITAEFVRSNGTTLTVRIGGKEMPVQMNQLSAESRRLAEQFTAAAATPAGFTNSLGMKFVPVPGTRVLFCIHETRYHDFEAYVIAMKQAEGSWKNQTYAGHEIRADAEEHPITKITPRQAFQFCAWLSQKEGKTYRLPTSEEWQIAAGAIKASVSQTGAAREAAAGTLNEFPWGNTWPPPQEAGNYADTSYHKLRPADPYIPGYNDDYPTTAPVMKFKPNAFGLYDMGGNVWEMTHGGDPANAFLLDYPLMIQHGASFLHDSRESLKSTHKNSSSSGQADPDKGFRVVLETIP